jgi:sulfatase modifying factor 1
MQRMSYRLVVATLGGSICVTGCEQIMSPIGEKRDVDADVTTVDATANDAAMEAGAPEAGADADHLDGTPGDASDCASDVDAADVAVEDAGDSGDGEASAADAADGDACGGDACAESADADASDGDADAEPPCTAGAMQCDETGTFRETCAGGVWPDAGSACASFCIDGSCVAPPSCNGGYTSDCGMSGTDNCCSSRTVPGGTFDRSYDRVTFTDPSYTATIAPFSLDVYEVTVGRFRNFVAIYDALGPPTSGSGKNANDPNDMGWNTSWNANMPQTADDLQTELSCSYGTWTPSAGSNEALPISCVDWFTALAFCIWDGGRLPTEAEWNFAAAGGSEQREYPWGMPNDATEITSDYAIYSTYGFFNPAPVGTAWRGAGKWAHVDLVGNVDEWTRDYFASPYSSTSCDNCADFEVEPLNAVRGGDFIDTLDNVNASVRAASDPTIALVEPTIGLRCARNL